MRLRKHRELLDDSMETVVEIDPTMPALVEKIQRDLGADGLTVKVEHYCYDSRIGWDTHIVTIEGIGVYGFTDSPLKTAPSVDSSQ